MKSLVLLTLFASLCTFALAADDQAKESKATDRVQAAADVLNQIQGAPDSGIPREILSKAECVAVVPSMLNGGFIVGAKYGRGLASLPHTEGLERACIFHDHGRQRRVSDRRTGGRPGDADHEQRWHATSAIEQVCAGRRRLGGCGPVGRHAEGNTDWKMRAQVLTYSRARGVFAGVSLNGAVVKQDKDSTREFYGHMVTFKAALTGEVDPPPAANSFLTTLANWRRRRRSRPPRRAFLKQVSHRISDDCWPVGGSRALLDRTAPSPP